MSRSGTVAVYFVASPLQYLAARRIAGNFEAGSRQVLVWYKPGLDAVVDPREWDACSYMAWPRLEPLPGPFGRHRRLRANIGLVAGLVGPTAWSQRRLRHRGSITPRALPAACGARDARAHPARRDQHSPLRCRRWPRAAARATAPLLPELDYQCFGGDRIGSVSGLNLHLWAAARYPVTVGAAPLVDAGCDEPAKRRALVTGGR